MTPPKTNVSIFKQGVQYINLLFFTGALTYILSAGGNPNPVSPDTSVPSPLHYAVSEGYKDCAQILIEAGANVNAFIITEKVSQNKE